MGSYFTYDCTCPEHPGYYGKQNDREQEQPAKIKKNAKATYIKMYAPIYDRRLPERFHLKIQKMQHSSCYYC